jgi:DNA polymerase III epsilon subunit-like protein
VLDLETTGLGEHDRICEIAIVMMRGGKVDDVWSSLVNPGFPIPVEATAIHGITDAMVAGAPTIQQLRDKVSERLASAAVLVGYNIYRADQPWLERELPGAIGSLPVIDPLVIVRSSHVGKYWKSDYTPTAECPICDEDKPAPQPRPKVAGRHRLARAAEMLGCCEPEDGFEIAFHRAAWDALLAGRVLWKLIHLCGPDPRKTEVSLREEGARQEAELQAFKARMVAEEQAKRERRRASLALRVSELEAENERLRQQLEELNAATLAAASDKPADKEGVE